MTTETLVAGILGKGKKLNCGKANLELASKCIFRKVTC